MDEQYIQLEETFPALEARLHNLCASLDTSEGEQTELRAANVTLVSECDTARQSVDVLTTRVAGLEAQAQVPHAPPFELADAVREPDRRRALL